MGPKKVEVEDPPLEGRRSAFGGSKIRLWRGTSKVHMTCKTVSKGMGRGIFYMGIIQHLHNV